MGVACGAARIGTEDEGETLRRTFESWIVGPLVVCLVVLVSLSGRAEAAEVTGTIAIGGDALTVSMPAAGDTARITFAGSAGQQLGLGLSGVTVSSLLVYVYQPDGAQIAWSAVSPSSGELDFTLSVSGMYTILLDPYLNATGSATLTLSEDVVGSIAVDSSATSVSVTRIGQNGRVSFDGGAGQALGLAVSGVPASVTVYVRSLAGSQLTWGSVSTSGAELDFTLPSTGTYEVVLDPYNAGVPGSVTLTLSTDVAGTISAGGATASVSLPRLGQNGRVTFSGIAGEQLGLGASGVTGFATGVELDVRNPDGSTLKWGVSTNSGKELDFTLPTAGTYTIFIDPYTLNTGSLTLTLSEDIAGSIAIGGSSQSVTIPRIGQNGRFSFSGTAGQRLGIGVSGVTIGSCCDLTVWVLKPDGSSLSQTLVGTNGAEVDVPLLPQSGTYTILVDPDSPYTGSATVTLSEDIVEMITTGAGSVSVTMGRMGQNARVSFAGAAGQTLRLGLSAVTIGSSTCCSASAKVLKPDGGSLTSILFGTDGKEADVATLPLEGTYTVFLDPDKLSTGSITMILKVRGDAPYDGADVSSCGTVPVFRAQPVAGATQYQFQLASDSGFSSIVSDSGLLPKTNTFTPPPGALASGQTYRWRWKTGTGSWSTGRSFTTNLPKLGARESAATWSLEPLTVNLVNGNLLAGLPGPSYPTASGAMGVSLAYNSLDTANRGLGPGWLLDAGAGEAGAPLLLLDHNLLTGGVRLDAVEAIYADGSSTCYTHVGETGTYIAAPGDGQLLAKNADGSWTLTSGETIASFSVANGATGIAPLTAVESSGAAAGNGKLTYAYSMADPAKIAGVTDGAGRALTFTWSALNPAGCAAAIVCVTGPDGVTWSYVGDASGGTGGKLLRVNNGTRDLAQVGYDANSRVNKLQNANDLNPSAASPGYDGTHALTVAYDVGGKVASVSEGPVTGQSPTTATWSIAYSPGSVATSATRAAHAGMPLGTARTADGYTTVTPPRQQGQPSPKSTKTYYDNLGRAIEVVDLLGNRTLAHYNAREQLLWTEDEDGNPTDYGWDTINDVLLTSTGPDADGAGPLARPVVTNRYDETQIGTSTAPGAALEGLQASYYGNVNLAGRPAKRQTDSSVDFDWGSGGPAALGGQSDNFSIRWTSNLSIATAGSYTFATRADDGTRLTIDGIVAVDNWKDQTVATVSSQPITLAAGLHKLVLEYYERSGPAELELRYACSACTPAIADQLVPAATLRPAWLNQTSTVSPLGRVGFQHYVQPDAGLPDYTLARLDDGTNVITSFSYDSYGRITRRVMPKGNAARTIAADGTLQGSPNLQYATDWTYYGAAETAAPPAACGGGSAVNQGEFLKSTTPYGIATTTTIYDSGGRPIASSNGKGTTCSSYDVEGRLTSAKAPGDSQATTYAYDPAGQTRTITDASGTVSSQYDEAGRVKKSIDSYGAEANFSYDSEGNLISRTSAAGPLASSPNHTTSYGYDDEGALTSLTDPAGRSYSFFYDARSNLRATQYPNGSFSWNDYNPVGALTVVSNRHGTLSTPLPASAPADANPIVDYTYTYELEGRKTQEIRSGGGLSTETTGYVYDELGRLKTVNLPTGVTRSYSFDLDSNRTAISENGSTVATYIYDPATTPGVDQLTSVTENATTRTFTYNTDGDTTSYGDKTLTWDGWGRHNGGTFTGQTLGYEFDPTGFRRQRTSGSSITRYLHGGLYETDSAGAVTLTDIDGPAGDLAHYTGPPTTSSTVSYLYYNGHGDLAAEADATGTRTSASTYDPFGAPLQTLPANVASERWTGRWDKKQDASSGLIEMGARPYDPMLGRFLSMDPVEGASANAYDYSYQDPVNVYDLDGRDPWARDRYKARQKRERARATRLLREIGMQVAASFNIVGRYSVQVARNGKGIVIRLPGTTGNANTLRIMAANARNPKGYFRYYNKYGQPINPRTGKPGKAEDTHIPLDFKGELKGFPFPRG